jgi:hypothetical protein
MMILETSRSGRALSPFWLSAGDLVSSDLC